MAILWPDILLAFLMFLSGFLAMMRGLMREVLSILSWVLAAVATLYVVPNYRDQVHAIIPEPQILGDVILAVAVFLIVLIVCSFVTVKMSDRFLDSRVGFLDRSLGFAYGLGRGLILVSILFLIWSWLAPKDSMPTEVLEARSLPLVETTGKLIVSLLPENAAKELNDVLDKARGNDSSILFEPLDLGQTFAELTEKLRYHR